METQRKLMRCFFWLDYLMHTGQLWVHFIDCKMLQKITAGFLLHENVFFYIQRLNTVITIRTHAYDYCSTSISSKSISKRVKLCTWNKSICVTVETGDEYDLVKGNIFQIQIPDGMFVFTNDRCNRLHSYIYSN